KALVLATDGLIVHINQLASDLCGRAEQDLVGRCVVSELFAAVPAGLSTQMSQRWETEVKAVSGLRVPVEVTYERLGAGRQQLEVYAIRALRERLGNAARIESFNLRLQQQHELLKEQEKRLREQNVQLVAALNNIVQGLAMFDAQHRLVLCNRRYVEIYGLSPEQARVGTTLREIIEQRL